MEDPFHQCETFFGLQPIRVAISAEPQVAPVAEGLLQPAHREWREAERAAFVGVVIDGFAVVVPHLLVLRADLGTALLTGEDSVNVKDAEAQLGICMISLVPSVQSG